MVSNQTWTASSPKGCLHLNDITCPLGDGRGQNVDFAIFCSQGHPCFTRLVLFALGNERTLVRCKSCEALLKDLHATSVLSFHNAKKKCSSILIFMLKRQITPKSRKKSMWIFWSRDRCLSSENICHGFLILQCMRMTSECNYILSNKRNAPIRKFNHNFSSTVKVLWT